MLRGLSLYAKEMRHVVYSATAYIFVAVFLGLSSWLFFRTFFLQGQADMRPYFDILPLLLVLLLPSLSMRSIAEESQLGTLEVLLASPASTGAIVLAKWLALCSVVVVLLFVSSVIPLSVSVIGDLDWGVVFSSTITVFLFSAYALSIGIFFSSITDNQITAFILSAVSLFALFLIGQAVVLYDIPSAFVPFVQMISFTPHYDAGLRGVITLRSLVYFVSYTFFFLWLAALQLSSRRSS